MKSKMIFKISVDVAETILMLVLMARQITGETAHEWLGAGIFILWILHHILNARWYRGLVRGRCSPARIFHTLVNTALLISMLCMMVSGIVLSREVFSFLGISGGLAIDRQIHISSVFWGFVLMAVHLGLHWNMVLGMIRKRRGKEMSKTARTALVICGAAFAVYGLLAFIENQFLSYMFLTTHFVFFDYDKPTALFFLEYVAIMGLFVFLAHYISRGLGMIAKGKKERSGE